MNKSVKQTHNQRNSSKYRTRKERKEFNILNKVIIVWCTTTLVLGVSK
jgi:hypothetical protein